MSLRYGLAIRSALKAIEKMHAKCWLNVDLPTHTYADSYTTTEELVAAKLRGDNVVHKRDGLLGISAPFGPVVMHKGRWRCVAQCKNGNLKLGEVVQVCDSCV